MYWHALVAWCFFRIPHHIFIKYKPINTTSASVILGSGCEFSIRDSIHSTRLNNTPPRFLLQQPYGETCTVHDDVIKWKHFPRYWPFLRGIHRSPVNSPHKGQWRGALMFSLICVWINDWVNSREAGDLRRYLAHYDVIVMEQAAINHLL